MKELLAILTMSTTHSNLTKGHLPKQLTYFALVQCLIQSNPVGNRIAFGAKTMVKL